MTRLGWVSIAALAASTWATGVLGDNILKMSGFNNCGGESDIKVERVEISFNNDKKLLTFDVAGTNGKAQNVSANLDVTAYGSSVFKYSFNPCADDTFIEQLCPLPVGVFAAKGEQEIPEEYTKQIPAIAFQVPDIAASAKLELKKVDTEENVACIESQVSNGKTFQAPAVSYVAAGVASVALVVSGVSAASFAIGGIGSGGASASSGMGVGGPSPSFTETFGWFQGMAMNGMLSVSYPPIYRSFTKNFGFSTGLVPWTQLQMGIDSFRSRTGGNTTLDSIEVLKQTTLVFPDGSTVAEKGMFKAKRAFETFASLIARDIETSVNQTAAGDPTSLNDMKKTVSGISAYVEQLSVPKSNVFMTVLLVIAIIIASIAAGILLVKAILEAWALFGNFPKSLAGFREHYWGSIARAITSLILLLYGIWVLYCVFQFTQGDSWAAKLLAGVTLAIFTAVLLYFSWKIWTVVRQLKLTDGDVSGLYDEKDNWIKYSLFYESYKKDYWWIFAPTIIYMFIKGATLAATDGHGMAQTITQLIIEACMLAILLWSRPYERRSGTIINVSIQVVRVLSVACILVFVEEFGIAQTTQTVTGVVLIVVQSTLTGVLAILIAWNAINACCKENPHRKRRKEMGK